MENNRFSHLAVDFYIEPKLNKRKSKEEGRKIYDDVEYIRIRIAGDPKNVVVAPAHSASSKRDEDTNERLTYAQLHSAPYEAWKTKNTQSFNGTPLSELDGLKSSKIRELEDSNVYTIEALASLDGKSLNNLGMNARSLKDQAEEWLKYAEKKADTAKLAKENEELRKRLEALENAAPKPDATEIKNSPFSVGWEIEDIRNWISDNGGKPPRSDANLNTHIKAADELNAEITASQAA